MSIDGSVIMHSSSQERFSHRQDAKSKYDMESLAGIASAILSMVGAQIIMVSIIGLAIQSGRDQIFAGIILVVGLLLNGAAITVWNIAQKEKNAEVVIDHTAVKV